MNAAEVNIRTRVTTVDGRKRTVKQVLAGNWFILSDGTCLPLSALSLGWGRVS